MLHSRLLTLAAAASLTVAASAQQFCSDNTFPIHLVDAAGNELATEYDASIGEDVFVVPTEQVFLAFDPALPSGTYYVHVTDTPIDGLDEVLSQNDPMDRFVAVDNVGGVISLSLPFSSDPASAVYGLGLNGVGQSILLNPFAASQYSQCRFKVWFGDSWDLSNGPSNPYLLAGGIHPTTQLCAVRSYHSFRIGDGTGSDVCGAVFGDADHDGTRDAGESGLANWQVNLVQGDTVLPGTTDADGNYCFDNVPAGEWNVELVLQPGYTATTATSFTVQVCQCAPAAGGDFGVATMSLPCDGHTIGYWRNRHGLCKVQQYNILPTLPALCIVNQCGQYVAPANKCQFKWWLKCANAWNMAYMLSAQLVAMHCNVAVGFVHADCMINDPCLGVISIGELMQMAVTSLCQHPFTPPWSCHRAWQAKLKDALDRANNNINWL